MHFDETHLKGIPLLFTIIIIYKKKRHERQNNNVKFTDVIGKITCINKKLIATDNIIVDLDNKNGDENVGQIEKIQHW